MNKVYFFTSDEDRGGVYIAAPNWKEARKIARTTFLQEYAESFIDYKGHLVNKKIKTDFYGELSIKQLQQLDLLWFECSDCGSDEIKISDDDMQYTCECGHSQAVPYLD